jgi:hypothetical protein
MADVRTPVKRPSTSLVVTLIVAIIGWGLGLSAMVRASDLRMVTEAVVSEREARAAADTAMNDTLKQVTLNTKDVPALVAQMKIVLRRLGLDGG